jgi:outer membrane protein insertion porin family
VLAVNISKIECVGNNRIESETIEAYLPIQKGDECDEDSINEALKALSQTGLFEKVNINMKGSVLVVSVKEFPIINKISFEGNSKLSDKDIRKTIRLKEREALSPAKIKEIQQGLLEAYRKNGRYNASINPKVIKLPDDRVNLVFEINEGVAAGIGRIVFVGNREVSSSDLRDVMKSKIKRWYRFFATDDIYDPDRLSEDKIEIEKYYHNTGYANAKVLSAVAELSSNKKEFVLTFTIDEGDLYKLGNVSVKSSIPKIKVEELKKDLYCKSGDRFNSSLMEVDVKNITREIGKNGISAVNVTTKTTMNPIKKTVDVVYEITEGEKVYISKIVINGNTKTRDHIVRREVLLEEGDAYNKALVDMTQSNLDDLDFFKKVDVQTLPDPNSPDKCILQVSVEEKPTAEAMVSANYSTLGGIGVDLTYNDRNFFGTGKNFNVLLGSGREKSGKSREIVNGKTKEVGGKEKFRFLNNVYVGVTDPHLFDKDIEGSISGYRNMTSAWDGFDIKQLGGSVGISYDLSSKFTQSWEYEAANRKFYDVSRYASPLIRCQTQKSKFKKDGKCNLSSLKHTISYHTFFLTGIRGSLNVGLSTSVAGLGGDAKHLKNELFGSYTIPVFRKSALTFGLSAGLLSKFGGKDPNIIDSFMLGAEDFRGFEYAGMGPCSETLREIKVKNKEGKTIPDKSIRRNFIGGKKFWKGTIEYSFPLGLPEELQFRGFVFTDFGTIWDPTNKGKSCLKKKAGAIEYSGKYSGKYSKLIPKVKGFDNRSCKFDDKVRGHRLLDKRKIRQSIGLGISFITPFGPIKLTYAKPIRKEKYDEQYRLLFGFATTF